MVILKLPFQTVPVQKLEIPASANILTVSVKEQGVVPVGFRVEMHVAVNPKDTTNVYRSFITLGCGEKGPDSGIIYIGSYFIHGVGCHVFEVIDIEDPDDLDGVI